MLRLVKYFGGPRGLAIFAISLHLVLLTSNSPPAGLLMPPSHIALDFVTGLPLSAGNKVILTVINCMSKPAHFVPLPKLPSTKETARVVFNHVFKIQGFPLMSFLTGDRSLTLSFGSASRWKHPSVCRQGFTHRLMGRLNALTKFSVVCFASWCPIIPHPGVSNCPGPNTPITRYPRHPLDCLHFIVVSVTNLLCSLLRQRCPFPQYKLLFSDANAPGEG